MNSRGPPTVPKLSHSRYRCPKLCLLVPGFSTPPETHGHINNLTVR
jgi:hypothetical protein